jgi:hypothetical protein
MISILCRAILRMAAASTGLLLVFGIVYAMEGMTTRLPTAAVRELVISTIYLLPWTILFCSGFDDLVQITKREWLFWAGLVFMVAFVYLLNRNTSLQGFNKAGIPILACAFAIQPHIFRRIALLYSLVAVLFGLCGVAVLFYVVQTYYRGGSFVTRSTSACVFLFATSSIGAAALSIRQRVRNSQAAVV